MVLDKLDGLRMMEKKLLLASVAIACSQCAAAQVSDVVSKLCRAGGGRGFAECPATCRAACSDTNFCLENTIRCLSLSAKDPAELKDAMSCNGGEQAAQNDPCLEPATEGKGFLPSLGTPPTCFKGNRYLTCLTTAIESETSKIESGVSQLEARAYPSRKSDQLCTLKMDGDLMLAKTLIEGSESPQRRTDSLTNCLDDLGVWAGNLSDPYAKPIAEENAYRLDEALRPRLQRVKVQGDAVRSTAEVISTLMG